jgi:4-amino-4-deoxy-L-arabinose transferase-like glycosyltransferase
VRAGLIGVVIAVSAALVWSVATPVPHDGGDNAGYIALAHGLLTRGAYVDVFDPEGLRHTKYPPVFAGLLALLIAAGARTWAVLKLSAAIPTVVSAALTYLWAERRLGLAGAFAAALLFSMSAGVIYYSRWILSDPLFVTFTLLALWAGDRAAGDDAVEGADDAARARAFWLGLAIMGTGLAYFTRSAGLPLVLALFAWLAWERRWRGLIAAGAVLGVPMLAWLLRGRGEGVAQYGTEFWLVNPYDPGLGTVGFTGLMTRASENLAIYALQHGPLGVVGGGAGAMPLVGVALAVAAVAGWAIRIRERIGVAELFFPLYAGLILLWPAVWGGDRFALPLIPLIFVYGAGALAAAGGRIAPVLRRALPGVAFALLFVPAGLDWARQARQNQRCMEAVAEWGLWGCHDPSVDYFMAAATWSAASLPEDAAVLTRKPRHFYLESGRPSRAFPFTEDPEALLALSDRLGARYVLLDRWDGLASRYVGSAVQRRPNAFCWLAGFGSPQEGGAQLLGILPPELRDGGAVDPEFLIDQCPDAYYRDGVRDHDVDYSSSGRIWLLDERGS